MLDKIQAVALKVQRVVFIVVLAFMLVVLAAHVVMRYVFSNPLIWSEEITAMLQGVIAFLGIGYCFARGKHTELDLVYDRVPNRLQAVFDVLTNSVMLFCLVQLIITGFRHAAAQMIPMGTLPWVKLGYFYALVPIGFIIGSFYVVIRLVRAVRRLFSRDAAAPTKEG